MFVIEVCIKNGKIVTLFKKFYHRGVGNFLMENSGSANGGNRIFGAGHNQHR